MVLFDQFFHPQPGLIQHMDGWRSATANTPKPHAILFGSNEGSGSVLIRPINYGTQGETYIVRSLDDGEVYIRKKYIKLADQRKSEELSFCNLLPPSMAPQVVQHFRDSSPNPIFVYRFCNGGDLTAFFNKCCENEKAIPEALFWHLEK